MDLQLRGSNNDQINVWIYRGSKRENNSSAISWSNKVHFDEYYVQWQLMPHFPKVNKLV
jgi:hypothetical protein